MFRSDRQHWLGDSATANRGLVRANCGYVTAISSGVIHNRAVTTTEWGVPCQVCTLARTNVNASDSFVHARGNRYPSAVGAARAARKGMSEPLDGRICRLHIVDEQELAHILRINAWEECTSAHILIFQGCGVDVSAAAIQKYFSEWGDIMDCCHYVDPVTLKGSGCGRIAFKEPARAALVASLDTLPPLGSHNPTVTVIRREFMPQPATVFVRGLKPTTTAQALRRVLERFGFIIDCVVKQPRCFGFVTFEVPSVADAICAYRPHLEVDGKVVGITMKR